MTDPHRSRDLSDIVWRCVEMSKYGELLKSVSLNDKINIVLSNKIH